MYNNHDSLNKHAARLEVLKSAKRIIKRKGELRGLTLPSSNFIFEELLLKEGDVVLDCVERERAVYQEALEKASKYDQVSLYNCDVFNFLRKQSGAYNFIWLDLCGTLTQTAILDVVSLVQSPTLEKNSYLAVTLMGAREPQAKSLEEFYGTDMSRIRCSVFPNLVKEFAEQVGRRVKIHDILHYKSELKTKSAPMNVYGFSFI